MYTPPSSIQCYGGNTLEAESRTSHTSFMVPSLSTSFFPSLEIHKHSPPFEVSMIISCCCSTCFSQNINNKRFTCQVCIVTAGIQIPLYRPLTIETRQSFSIFLRGNTCVAGPCECALNQRVLKDACNTSFLAQNKSSPQLKSSLCGRKLENTWVVSSAVGLHQFSSADKAISTVLGNR